MKAKKKKMPNDYPLLAFRVSKSDHKKITSELKQLKTALNASREADEKLTKGNEIIAEALKIGFKAIRKRIKK